jgi:hypothetical protein
MSWVRIPLLTAVNDSFSSFCVSVMDRFARSAPRFSHSLALLSKIDYSGLSPRSLARTFSRGRSYDRSTRYDVNSFRLRYPNKVSYTTFFERPRYPSFSPRRPPLWPKLQRGGLILGFGALNLFGWSQTDHFRMGRTRLRWKGWHEKRKYRGRFIYARSYGAARFSFYYRHRNAYRRRRRALVAVRRAKWGRPVLRRVVARLPVRPLSIFSGINRRLSVVSDLLGSSVAVTVHHSTISFASVVARLISPFGGYSFPLPYAFTQSSQALPRRSYFRARTLKPWRRRRYRWRYKPRITRYRWFYASLYRQHLRTHNRSIILKKLLARFPELRLKAEALVKANKKLLAKVKAKRLAVRTNKKLSAKDKVRQIAKINKKFSLRPEQRIFSKFKGPRPSSLRRKKVGRRNRRFAAQIFNLFHVPRFRIGQAKKAKAKAKKTKTRAKLRPKVEVTVQAKAKRAKKPKRSRAARRRRARRRARHRSRWRLEKVPRTNQQAKSPAPKPVSPTKPRKARKPSRRKPSRRKPSRLPKFTRSPRVVPPSAPFVHRRRALRRRWATSRKRRHPARRLLNRLYPFAKGLRLGFWWSRFAAGLRRVRRPRRRARIFRRWVRRLRCFRAFSRSVGKFSKFRFFHRFSSQLRSLVYYQLRQTTALIRSRHLIATLLRFFGIFARSFRGTIPLNPGRVLRQQRLTLVFGNAAFYSPLVASWAKRYQLNPATLFLSSFSLFYRFGSLGFFSPYWSFALTGQSRVQAQFFTPVSLGTLHFLRTFGSIWPSLADSSSRVKSVVSKWLFAASVRSAQRRRLHSRALLPMLFALRRKPGTLRSAPSNLFNFALYDHNYIHYSVGRYKRLKNKRRARFRLR